MNHTLGILCLWKHKLMHNTHTLYPYVNICSEYRHIHPTKNKCNQEIFKLYSKILHSRWSTYHGILFLISHIANHRNSVLLHVSFPVVIVESFCWGMKRQMKRSKRCISTPKGPQMSPWALLLWLPSSPSERKNKTGACSLEMDRGFVF